jgi:hypothetical protein
LLHWAAPWGRQIPLHDQHAVPVTVEAVALGDCLAVGLHDEIAAREGAHEHEEGAFREVEIGQEGIDDLKFVGRVDENVGGALGFAQRLTSAAEMLEDAGHGGAHRDHALGLIDFEGRAGIEIVALFMHLVFGGVFDLHGSKSAGADVEGEEGMRK